MPNENAWSVITAPTSNSLILGVDFPAAGRREAGFEDLAKKMGPAWSGHGFLQTTPPPVRLADRPAGDFYTEHWLRDGAWEKYEVVAVMGYCVGGVYAAEIADRLAERQGTAPKVILFDAQVTDLQLLESEIHKMIGLAGPVFSADEAEHARKRAAEIVGTPSIGLLDAAVEIVDLYREMASIAFQRIGLADARRDEVVLLFESYMTWLSAASQIDPSQGFGRSLAITSSDYADLEKSGAATVVDASKALGRRISLEIGHVDLLRDDSTVRALLDHAEF
ncbi:hypothetical protein KV557_20460 [Kitasatospora aureofaciens]|uniref:hypothetical protein n=1 Tax=Kitasatospora aureofaciens TaxID=1894 RepID=UPI001C444C42|nr:hypothetical protein [Kitasatospora aureofaciens]MBV6699441.1 hypothetical protein [Kitasatospora aureofaciens]